METQIIIAFVSAGITLFGVAVVQYFTRKNLRIQLDHQTENLRLQLETQTKNLQLQLKHQIDEQNRRFYIEKLERIHYLFSQSALKSGDFTSSIIVIALGKDKEQKYFEKLQIFSEQVSEIDCLVKIYAYDLIDEYDQFLAEYSSLVIAAKEYLEGNNLNSLQKRSNLFVLKSVKINKLIKNKIEKFLLPENALTKSS